MVSNAQLDNEKQALLYQVDCLKDRYLCMVEIVVHVQELSQWLCKQDQKSSFLIYLTIVLFDITF